MKHSTYLYIFWFYKVCYRDFTFSLLNDNLFKEVYSLKNYVGIAFIYNTLVFNLQ